MGMAGCSGDNGLKGLSVAGVGCSGDGLGVVGTMGGKGRGCVSSGRRAAARRRRSVFFVRARSPA